MQRKHDICFKVLSLPTDEFQMKSNSTKLLFPLKAFCLLVFLENSVLRPAAFLVHLFSFILTTIFSLGKKF